MHFPYNILKKKINKSESYMFNKVHLFYKKIFVKGFDSSSTMLLLCTFNVETT